MLQLLQDLQVGAITQPEKIYQVIADNIHDVRQLLSIGGFFDRCRGRLYMDYQVEVKEGELYPLKTERGGVHDHVKYCEGRKAKIKGTTNPSICESTGKEFWWCRNSKCYQNCIDEHQKWKNFTVLDFCQTLKIPLAQDDYETLLGYINKINHYLAHMNCRSCKSILRPHAYGSNTNYGFYLASILPVWNLTAKYGKIIYLSHCTNGHCSGIIDQRDSFKCLLEQSGDKKFGWYTCNDCLVSCNTKNIERRNAF